MEIKTIKLLQTFLTGNNVRGAEATAKDYQRSAYLAFGNYLRKICFHVNTLPQGSQPNFGLY